MIDYLRIENFKCWQDTTKIRLAPITVLFGSNSSGKSSIGQFLMMLKQSVESSDRKSVFFTGNDHTAVDVGLPSDIIFEKDNSRHIKFEYGWELKSKEELELNNAVTKEKKNIKEIGFSSDVKLIRDSQKLEVESLCYKLKDTKGVVTEITLRQKELQKNNRRAYELDSRNYAFKRIQGRAWDISTTVRFYGFPDEAVAYYQNADFLQNINLTHEKLFSSIYYLGPLRNKAKRLYTWPGSVPRDSGISGEDAINAILASRSEGRKINLKAGGKYKTLEEIIAEELKKLSLIDEFKLVPISKDRSDYEVKIRTRGSKQYVDIPDVGVGVSQVLPVVVELFYAPPGSTIIIEQPELHLHPSAQAALADVVIDAIRARENSKDRRIQLIIESHSEHFLRRLQRRMAEEVISTDELSAYFIKYHEGAAVIDPLQINKFGDIENWPEGFFGDIQEDIYQQAIAGYNQRTRGKREVLCD